MRAGQLAAALAQRLERRRAGGHPDDLRGLGWAGAGGQLKAPSTGRGPIGRLGWNASGVPAHVRPCIAAALAVATLLAACTGSAHLAGGSGTPVNPGTAHLPT